jgi:exonuclease VII small subunit
MEQKNKKQKSDIGAKLDKLAEIVAWFDEQKEVDVEKGLEKAREGAALIRGLKEKMKDVENEFKEIKKELQSVDEE